MNITLQELAPDEVFWINTSHERDVDYIYQGMQGKEHRFMREGSIKDTMRITLVMPEFLRIDGKRVTIVGDNYRVDEISKDDKPEEYERLQRLWRSKIQ